MRHRILALLAILGMAVVVASCLPAADASVVTPSRTYAQEKASLEAKRVELAAASDGAAFAALCKGITEQLIPHWYGTPWDFNGVTRTPGEGSIACGYFITTLAVDAGIQLERARLAQQASSVIIRTLCDETTIKRHWKGFDDFLAHMRQSPDGLYIVGLDFHCGFFLKDKTGMHFIHSNYIGRKGVMKEKAESSQALSDSKSFMSGCMSSNVKLARAWRKGEKISIAE